MAEAPIEKQIMDAIVKDWPDESVPMIVKAFMWFALQPACDETHPLREISDELERIADALEKIEKRGRPDPGYGIF